MDSLNLRARMQSMRTRLHAWISTYMFLEVGLIKELSSSKTRATVVLPYLNEEHEPITIPCVELLRVGNSAVTVKVEPQEGDCVMLFCPRSYIESMVEKAEPKEKPNFFTYGEGNIKGLVVQSEEQSDAPLTIEVTSDGAVTIDSESDIAITSKGAVTLDAEGDVTLNGHLKVTK